MTRWTKRQAASLEEAFAAAYGGEHGTVELPSGVRLPKRVTATFDDEESGMTATLAAEVRHHEVTVRKFELEAVEDDDRGLDRDRLRAVPLSDLTRQAIAGYAYRPDPERGGMLGSAADEATAELGRDRPTDDLAEVARVYLQHQGSTPTQAVAYAFNLSNSGAAKRVMKARAAGYLPPTKPGVPTNRRNGA